MSAQTWITFFQGLMFAAAILAAIGAYGSFHFKQAADREKQEVVNRDQSELRSRIAKLQATYETNTTQIFQALRVKQDQWIEVQATHVPPTCAYLLLLFRSDKGRIEGKVRVKGADRTSSFSTTSNDTVPVAVQNLWEPTAKEYKRPIILEFAVTEKTQPDATLAILTHGWIDDLGQEPH